MDDDETSMELPGGKVIGLGLSSSMKAGSSSTVTKDVTRSDLTQPSPPPPYGPIPLSQISLVSTPPTQDIDHDPLDQVHTEQIADEDDEEIQRQERATDLAKSLGLKLLSPPKLSTEDSVEESMDAEEIRKQLRQMKRRLKVRDHGMSLSRGGMG